MVMPLSFRQGRRGFGPIDAEPTTWHVVDINYAEKAISVTDDLEFPETIADLCVDDLPPILSRMDTVIIDQLNRQVIKRTSKGVPFLMDMNALHRLRLHVKTASSNVSFNTKASVVNGVTTLLPYRQAEYGPAFKVQFTSNNHGWEDGADVSVWISLSDGYGVAKRVRPGVS